MSTDKLRFRPDGTERHASTVQLLRHFRFDHLIRPQQELVEPVNKVAYLLADRLSDGPNLTHKLLQLADMKQSLVLVGAL